MRTTLTLSAVLILAGVARSQDDPKKQQERIEALEKTVKELQQKSAPAPQAVQAPPASTQKAPVRDKGSLNDQQDAAPRLDSAPLDPKYTGFFMIPGTGAIMKINAKPRVDLTMDNKNSGNDSRFVQATIPVEPNEDAGLRTNINAKASQLRIDVRAPEVDGAPRFYYQNDFFGSGGGEFPYRIQHLYGQIYNITVGHTYSVFEDPDAWPDTVDYEGPNSMVFARRALVRYQAGIGEGLALNFGVEQPESLPTDLATGDPDGVVTGINHLPDFTGNLRLSGDWGHAQAAAILRYLAADSTVFDEDEVVALGLNLSGSLNLGEKTTFIAQLTLGQGIGTLGNDSGFQNTDIAYDADGDLVALPYISVMVAATHRWTDEFRSTASFGFVNVDDGDATLDAGSYNRTVYVSGNLVWQLRKRLSIGAELLYGANEVQGGEDGDVVRFQIGLVYALFD